MKGESVESTAPLIRLERIVKRFGLVRALDRVDLEILAGQFTIIFGPNGAGKTTLLKVLASLSRPDSGRISATPPSRGRVGYLSHQSLLYQDLTGEENLELFGALYGVKRPLERARHLLDRLGLAKASDRVVRTYSRGMRQRAMLARALINDPELLILDEPFSGLDIHGSKLLEEMLAGAKAEGMTIVLVTHQVQHGYRLADRAVVLFQGRVVMDRTTSDLSMDEFESRYLESTGSLAGSDTVH